MDCPTEPNITNKIDEITAKKIMKERFDSNIFRYKLTGGGIGGGLASNPQPSFSSSSSSSNLSMTIERFRAEVDKADVYFLFDYNNLNSLNSSIIINSSLKERGFMTWYDKGHQELNRGIQGSDCIIVLINQSYIDKISSNDLNDRCKFAFNVAITKKNLGFIIPIILDSTLLETVFWNGDIGKSFAGRKVIDMSGDLTHIDYLNNRMNLLEEYILQIIGIPFKTRVFHPHSHSHNNNNINNFNLLKDNSQNELFNERKDISELTITEVSNLLMRCKLSNYVDIFYQNEIDGYCLSLCQSEQEISELGINILPKARVLYTLLQEFNEEGGVPIHLITKKSNNDENNHFKSSSDNDNNLINGGGNNTNNLGNNNNNNISSSLSTTTTSSTTNNNNNNNNNNTSNGVTTSSSTTTLTSTSSSASQSITPSLPIVSRLQPIRVSGCTGDRAHDINGIYDPTEEMHDGFCRYLKRGGQNNWIEYNATRGHWHIKKAESKGSVNAWAYAVSPCVAPDMIDPSCIWHVYNGYEFPEQPDLQLTRVYESIMVRGAVGTCAQQVNGIFDPTNEICGGWVRYRKRGGQDSWIEYSEVRGQWHIKPSASKNTTNAWAYMVCKPVCSLEKQKGAFWHLYDGTKFDKQESVLALPEAVPICIKGATGSCMNQVNGIFDPCDEVYGGFVRYRKRGGQDCWMEYNELRKQWHIKPEASKTTTNAWAYAVYPTPIAPHKRRSVWHLYDGTQFEKQSEVIVMQELKPVIISGAVGNVAPQVNGIFDPTDEICNGWVRYRKRGGQDCWMEYMESKGQWHIKPSASKRSTNAWAYATCRPVQPPQDIGDIWRLYDGTKFEDHPNVTIVAEPDDESRELARWLREIQNSEFS